MEGNLCDRSKNTPEDGRVINRQGDRLQTTLGGSLVAKIQMKLKMLPPPLTFLGDQGESREWKCFAMSAAAAVFSAAHFDKLPVKWAN